MRFSEQLQLLLMTVSHVYQHLNIVQRENDFYHATQISFFVLVTHQIIMFREGTIVNRCISGLCPCSEEERLKLRRVRLDPLNTPNPKQTSS